MNGIECHRPTGPITRPCGQSYWVMVRAGYYQRIWVPAKSMCAFAAIIFTTAISLLCTGIPANTLRPYFTWPSHKRWIPDATGSSKSRPLLSSVTCTANDRGVLNMRQPIRIATTVPTDGANERRHRDLPTNR